MNDARLLLRAFWETLKAIGREIRAISPAFWIAMNIVVVVWVIVVLAVQ